MTKSQWGRRGASSAFALIIFLMTTLFSVTMVNGALTAVQNASLQRVDEQSYLCVTSAARLFCEQVPTVNCHIDDVSVKVARVQDLAPGNRDWTLDEPANVIQQAFFEMMKTADMTGKETSCLLTMKPPTSSSSGAVPGFTDVTVSLTTQTNYSVTATFQNEESSPTPYYISVTLSASDNQTLTDDGEGTPINNLHRQMTWTVTSVERGRRT